MNKRKMCDSCEKIAQREKEEEQYAFRRAYTTMYMMGYGFPSMPSQANHAGTSNKKARTTINTLETEIKEDEFEELEELRITFETNGEKGRKVEIYSEDDTILVNEKGKSNGETNEEINKNVPEEEH